MAKNEVAKSKESNYAVMQCTQEELSAALEGNLGGGSTVSIYDLEQIKNPGKGSMQWVVPCLEGEKLEKEIKGIIVGKRARRSYWMTSVDEGGEGSPDCASEDGVTGRALTDDGPGGDCAECPMNEWGSDPKGGAGKACKETMDLVVVGEDDMLPVVVNLPPTSLKSFNKYMLRLTKARKPFFGVVTAISLEPKTMRSGQKTSEAQFNVVNILDEDELERIKTYTESLKGIINV